MTMLINYNILEENDHLFFNQSFYNEDIILPFLMVSQYVTLAMDPMNCSSPGSLIHGILQARILKWSAISFLQGIFLTQGLNLVLPHCKQTLYCLSYQGSPIGKKVALNCRRTVILKRKKTNVGE